MICACHHEHLYVVGLLHKTPIVSGRKRQRNGANKEYNWRGQHLSTPCSMFLCLFPASFCLCTLPSFCLFFFAFALLRTLFCSFRFAFCLLHLLITSNQRENLSTNQLLQLSEPWFKVQTLEVELLLWEDGRFKVSTGTSMGS